MKKLLILLVVIVFAAPTAALADGRIDYKAKCATCHGATLSPSENGQDY